MVLEILTCESSKAPDEKIQAKLKKVQFLIHDSSQTIFAMEDYVLECVI